MLDFESPELDTAAYLRQLAAEADGVAMLPGLRGNRLRSIADLMDAIDEQARVANSINACLQPLKEAKEIPPDEQKITDMFARTFGGG